MENPQPRPIGRTLQQKQTADDEIARLRHLLSNAVAQRGRYYKSLYAFTVRFESDDTSAFKDTKHFQDMVRILGIPPAREILIAKTDRHPSWTLRSILQGLVKTIEENDERSLIIGHYAGHAGLDVDDKIIFCDTIPSHQKLYHNTFEELYGENSDALSKTDMVLIFDSCYSGLITRGSETIGRSVELISAVGSAQKALGNFTDLARTQNITFTCRLATEVARRAGRGDAAISFAEIIGDMRISSQSQRLPEYSLRKGSVSIRIPLRAAKTTTPSGSSESYVIASGSVTSQATAIFKVHLKESRPDGPEVATLIEWLHSLNAILGLELSGVYESGSTLLLLKAPWFIWAELQGLSGFSFVADTVGGNRLSGILSRMPQNRPESSSQGAARSSPQGLGIRKENIPPHLQGSSPKK
jgi:hypothetical protein